MRQQKIGQYEFPHTGRIGYTAELLTEPQGICRSMVKLDPSHYYHSNNNPGEPEPREGLRGEVPGPL